MKAMKKITAVFTAAVLTFMFISCASNDTSDYDYNYDYTEDEYGYINDTEPVSSDDFLANIDPVELQSIFFLYKSGKKVTPKEIKKVYLVPRTNAVELHFHTGANQIGIVLRKAERDKILDACRLFLQQYEEKTLPHTKVNKKNAYFSSTCSLWYGVLTPSNGCEKNIYYMICEFINKKPYLLLRFAPTQTTTGERQSTPKISLYMSPSQIRDFLEIMDQENLERTIQETKKKAYTY